MRKTIVMLLLFVGSNSALADTLVQCSTGGANLAMCASEWENSVHNGNQLVSTNAAWNVAYFQGFVDGIVVQAAKKKFCFKEVIQTDQLYAIAAKYIRENPEKWNQNPNVLVIDSIARAFPCDHKSK